MKLKDTNNIGYLEAKNMHENQPEMKDASTQYKTQDCKITTSTNVIESKVKSTSKSPSG